MLKRPTLIVLGVFVILLVVAILIQRNQGDIEIDSGTSTESSLLMDIDEAEIVAMNISSLDGSQIIINKDAEGHWIVDDLRNELVDVARIESAVSQAGMLSTISKLELEVSLADLGLDQPNYEIVVTLSNGEQLVAYIGDSTPTNNGYYAYSNGVPIQVVNKFNVDSVLEVLIDPPILSQTENSADE
jgi:hypothetical protein